MNEEEEIKKRQEWNNSETEFYGSRSINWINLMFGYVLKRPTDCKIDFPDSEWYPSNKTKIIDKEETIKKFKEMIKNYPENEKIYQESINFLQKEIDNLDPNIPSPVVHFASNIKFEHAIKIMNGEFPFRVNDFQVYYF